MSLYALKTLNLSVGAPRMSGDEPEVCFWLMDSALCSPHERG